MMLDAELLNKIKAEPDKLQSLLEAAGYKIDEVPTTASDDNTTDGTGDISKLSPETQKYIRELRRENEKYRKNAKESQAALEAAEQAKLAEQGKYKELFEKAKTENESLKTQAQTAVERAKALEESVRKELLGRLPEGLRSKYNEIDVSLLRTIVTDFATTDAPNSPGASAAKPATGVPQSLRDLSDEQQMDLAVKNPELFNQLTEKLIKDTLGG